MTGVVRVVGIAGRKGSGKSTAAAHLRTLGFVEVPFAAPLKQRCAEVFALPPEAVYGPSEAREVVVPGAMRDGLPVNAWWTAAWERWKAAGFWGDLFSTLAPEADILRGFGRSIGREVSADILADDADLRAALIAYHARGVFAYLWARGVAITPRTILQQIGTQYGRGLWPDVWAHAWSETAARVLAGQPPTPGLPARKGRTGACDAAPVVQPAGVTVSDVRFPGEVRTVEAHGGVVLWIDAEKRLGPQTDFHASEPPLDTFVAEGLSLDVVDANGTKAETARAVLDVLRMRGVAV